jgi:hypothetical protein
MSWGHRLRYCHGDGGRSARRVESKKADGVKRGRVLQAEGEAQAIELIYQASNQYFT